MSQNKKIKNAVKIQSQLLKCFQETGEFLRQWVWADPLSTLKQIFNKFLNKRLVVKKSALSSNYFKNNFKLIKKVWHKIEYIFGDKY